MSARVHCDWCGRYVDYVVNDYGASICPGCQVMAAVIAGSFRPLAEIHEETPPEPSWLLRDYIAPGAVTLLAGKPKCGKSTLAAAITTAIDDAEVETFLDRPVGSGAVVYVSEEGAGTFAPKVGGTSWDSKALTRDAAWPKPSWPALIAAAVDVAEGIGAVLLVIDSLSFWAAFREGQAKDAGAAQATLDALSAATSAGLAVLVVHHQRKAGGEEGDAVRDSSAIVGAVDMLVELERIGDEAPAQRRLVAMGRWPKTPPVLVVERDPTTGDWRAVRHAASREEAAAFATRDRILAALPAEGEGLTMPDLAELLDLDKRKVSGPLRALVDVGLATRSGAGKRGNPYRFKKVSQEVSSAGTQTGAEKVSSPVGGTPSASVAHSVPGTEKTETDGRHDPAEVERLIRVAEDAEREFAQLGLDADDEEAGS